MPLKLVWRMLFYFVLIYAHKLLITKNILSRNSGESILQSHAEECHPSLTCSLIKCPVGTTLKTKEVREEKERRLGLTLARLTPCHL